MSLSTNKMQVACIAGILMLVSGCASSPARVMLRENGQAEAVASSKKEGDAVIAAVDAAQRFCKDKGKEAIFASEKGKDRNCPEQPEDRALGVLKKLPGIGKAFEGDEKNEVGLRFRCA
ncbi:MAG: hypothetical protein A2070_03885 [Bdellovibrionales bacterium GWC1_52_8]|nr:MAG: hypothetical protein A2070_03885 [Bdellovibrionales bacterium GWC1_52_8]